jgi:hypothetical protein
VLRALQLIQDEDLVDENGESCMTGNNIAQSSNISVSMAIDASVLILCPFGMAVFASATN